MESRALLQLWRILLLSVALVLGSRMAFLELSDEFEYFIPQVAVLSYMLVATQIAGQTLLRVVLGWLLWRAIRVRATGFLILVWSISPAVLCQECFVGG